MGRHNRKRRANKANKARDERIATITKSKNDARASLAKSYGDRDKTDNRRISVQAADSAADRTSRANESAQGRKSALQLQRGKQVHENTLADKENKFALGVNKRIRAFESGESAKGRSAAASESLKQRQHSWNVTSKNDTRERGEASRKASIAAEKTAYARAKDRLTLAQGGMDEAETTKAREAYNNISSGQPGSPDDYFKATIGSRGGQEVNQGSSSLFPGAYAAGPPQGYDEPVSGGNSSPFYGQHKTRVTGEITEGTPAGSRAANEISSVLSSLPTNLQAQGPTKIPTQPAGGPIIPPQFEAPPSVGAIARKAIVGEREAALAPKIGLTKGKMGDWFKKNIFKAPGPDYSSIR